MPKQGERAARRERIATAARLRDEGHSVVAIADEMGLTPAGVARWLAVADKINEPNKVPRFVRLAHPVGGYYYVNPSYVSWFTDVSDSRSKLFMAGDSEGLSVEEPVSNLIQKLGR